MRAYSSVGAWFLFGGIALACSGASFTTTGGDGGSGGSGDSASGGSQTRAGSHSGGSATQAGSTASGGTDAVGGAIDTGGTDVGGTGVGGTAATGGVGVAGDVSVGGSVVTAGTTSTGGVAGAPMGGSAGTGGTGGPPVDEVCPKTQPSTNGLCKDGLVCTYGNDARTQCRNTAKCDAGKWVVERPNCPGLNTCENVSNGKACMGEPACLLDKVSVCTCTACAGGAVCMVDTMTWSCTGNPGVGCPNLAPNVGQACQQLNSKCSYGSCAAGDPVNASCTNGFWSWERGICPL